MDFDGVARTDGRDVTFIIDGTEIVERLVSGSVTLSIECQTRGRITVGVAPVELTMIPFTVEVI